jgi:hypothetical protein
MAIACLLEAGNCWSRSTMNGECSVLVIAVKWIGFRFGLLVRLHCI